MPKNLTPENRWETEFQVPLPGEPRNIGPLETLFQRLLNRTERLKNRIGAILGMSWDATPPDTLAGLAGRVGTLESNQGGTTLAVHRTATTLDHPDGSVTSSKLADGAVTTPKIADGAVTLPKLANVSTEPIPNTVALRNSQGAVQDGANYGIYRVVKVNGIYEWSTGSRWVRIVQWVLSPTGRDFRGIFADLHFTEPNTLGLGSRVRVRAYTNASGVFLDPAISISRDYLGGNSHSGIITDAALVQTGPHTVELWVHSPTRVAYVQGLAATNAESVTLSPYGTISDQPAPPSPIPGGLYLDWSSVTADQTFVGPGNIVAASRSVSSGYIRYDNGMQICWAQHEPESFGNVETGLDNNYKYRSKTWVFPAAFVTAPVVIASGDVVGSRVDVINVYGHNPIQCILEVGQYNTDNVDPNATYTFAIGRWK